METEKNLNYKNYKQSHEDFKKLKRKMAKFALENLDRDFLIEYLKKKKIIKIDWSSDSYKITNTFMSEEESSTLNINKAN